MIQIHSKDFDPIQRGFSVVSEPLKSLKKTSFGQVFEQIFSASFQCLEGAAWGYFVYDGVSKVQNKYKEKSFYEKINFHTLDTFSNELYLLSNTVKLVFWFSKTVAFHVMDQSLGFVLKIASAVADVFYSYVYCSWMLDEANQASLDEKRLESCVGNQIRSSNFYEAKSVVSLGNFSANYSYALYSGLSVLGLIYSTPFLTVVSAVCLVGFLTFGVLAAFGDVSTKASSLSQEYQITSLSSKISKDSLSI